MNRILEQHICDLSRAHVLDVLPDHVIVRDYLLPPGYNYAYIMVWLNLARNYPEAPPGLPPQEVFVPQGLLYRGRVPIDYHDRSHPPGWAWWCFREVLWDPCRDDLVTFFETLRGTMTHPITTGGRI